MENFKEMTDSELIVGMKDTNDSGDCLMELVSRHSGIFMTMVHNYLPNSFHDGPSYKSELIEDRNYYIYQAALKYDEDRNTKFSTYLGNETRWMCLNLYNKNKNKTMKEVGLDCLKTNDINSRDEVKLASANKEMLDRILKIADTYKDSRIAKIFKLRYLDSEGNKVTPWKNIGGELNLSIQGCINIHNKAVKKIKKQLEKEI
jgi:DNA-directed RNA polymerase sigma subunit (sigma70/sigma32)